MSLSPIAADAPLTVFVVDDEERVREMLSRRLRQNGFAVRCFESSGVATVEAIVSGLAPGSEVETEMVGKSICGSGAIGTKG